MRYQKAIIGIAIFLMFSATALAQATPIDDVPKDFIFWLLCKLFGGGFCLLA